jgi:hypothetical protein
MAHTIDGGSVAKPQHLYFAYPPGVACEGLRFVRALAAGLEVKAAGVTRSPRRRSMCAARSMRS